MVESDLEVRKMDRELQDLRFRLAGPALRLDDVTTWSWAEALARYPDRSGYVSHGLRWHREGLHRAQKMMLQPAAVFGIIGVWRLLDSSWNAGVLLLLSCIPSLCAWAVATAANRRFERRQGDEFDALRKDLARFVDDAEAFIATLNPTYTPTLSPRVQMYVRSLLRFQTDFAEGRWPCIGAFSGLDDVVARMAASDPADGSADGAS